LNILKKSLNVLQNGDSRREGKSTIFFTFGVFEKRYQKAPPFPFPNSKWLNDNTWLDSGREGKSTKYSLLAYFEQKPPKSPPKIQNG